MNGKVRVLIVEDSESLLQLLVRAFEQDSRFIIAGTARNGQEAIEKTLLLKPDVITMDLMMPKVDGFEAIRQIMARKPTPIVVVTSSNDSQNSFEAVRAGALEVVSKPTSVNTPEGLKTIAAILDKAKIMSGVKVLTRKTGFLSSNTGSSVQQSNKFQNSFNDPLYDTPLPKVQARLPSRRLSSIPKIVAIASSTGGPPALSKVLGQIGKGFPIPILIVQHITPGFGQGLISWLSQTIGSHIMEAKEDILPMSGNVYIAPDNFHLLVDVRGRLKLSSALPIKGHRPSANPLFESVAQYYGPSAIGVVLTGMGDDGMLGMRALKQVGALCIAQDEVSSVVYGMPKAVADAGLVDEVLGLSSIGNYLLKLVS
ncbi:MAG: chemotaxis-specific protein-glutamate methyltransferase CheB [Acidobacteria bacterium]|nr:chemotaxis-specific protein-glutamate methyltransferase CheB [Acidobacteriota bacterium]